LFLTIPHQAFQNIKKAQRPGAMPGLCAFTYSIITL